MPSQLPRRHEAAPKHAFVPLRHALGVLKVAAACLAGDAEAARTDSRGRQREICAALFHQLIAVHARAGAVALMTHAKKFRVRRVGRHCRNMKFQLVHLRPYYRMQHALKHPHGFCSRFALRWAGHAISRKERHYHVAHLRHAHLANAALHQNEVSLRHRTEQLCNLSSNTPTACRSQTFPRSELRACALVSFRARIST